jgi:hypothetical protein
LNQCLLILGAEVKVEKGYTRILSSLYDVVNRKRAWGN